MSLIGKFMKYLLKEDSASHGGTSKKINDANNLMPSYKFSGKMVLIRMRQDVICTLLRNSKRKPSFLNSCIYGVDRALFIVVVREVNSETIEYSKGVIFGGLMYVQFKERDC